MTVIGRIIDLLAGVRIPRVVLDTNLFIAAYWNQGCASAKIIDYCLGGKLKMIYSKQTNNELFLILRNIKARSEYKSKVSDLYKKSTKITKRIPRVKVIKEDPEDDKYLACAKAGRAHFIITNDNHLLKLKSYKGTRIVRPSDFYKSFVNYPTPVKAGVCEDKL